MLTTVLAAPANDALIHRNGSHQRAKNRLLAPAHPGKRSFYLFEGLGINSLNDLTVSGKSGPSQFPALFVADPKTRTRVRDFFTAHIRNPNTRRAYRNAALRFSEWCQGRGIGELAQVETIHVSAYIEEFSQSHSRPTVKQHLAALKMLFDWLVLGQVIPANPASVVRGPAHSQKKGKTPVLTPEEARELLDAIETDTLIGLRDRALIALLVYSFSRVGAAVKMRVEDFYTQGRRGWVRLHEKGGKQHEMPAHHNLDALSGGLRRCG